MTTRILRICSLLLGAAATAGGQGTDPEHTPGSLKINNQIASSQGLTAAQRAAATAATNSVINILRRDPAIASPIGYSVTLRTVASPRLPGDAPGMPYHSIIFGRAYYYMWGDNGRGGRVVELDNGGFDFVIGINTAGYAAEMETSDPEADKGPRIMGADEGGNDTYRVTGSFRGRPMYNGSCTYLSHRSVPPIVPMTKERYYNVELLKLRGTQSRHDAQRADMSKTTMSDQLQKFLRDRPAREASNRKTLDAMKTMGADSAQIRQTAQTFRDMEKQQEAALRQVASDGSDRRMQDIIAEGRAGEADHLAQVQSTLDALSPAERRSPVALLAHGRNEFSVGEVSDTASLPLMQPNTAFYDGSIGADIPQLIWICGYHLQGLEDRGYERLADGSAEQLQEKAWNERRIRDVGKLRDQLDWAALGALIKP